NDPALDGRRPVQSAKKRVNARLLLGTALVVAISGAVFVRAPSRKHECQSQRRSRAHRRFVATSIATISARVAIASNRIWPLRIVLSTGLVAGTRIGNEQRRCGFRSATERFRKPLRHDGGSGLQPYAPLAADYGTGRIALAA